MCYETYTHSMEILFSPDHQPGFDLWGANDQGPPVLHFSGLETLSDEYVGKSEPSGYHATTWKKN